MKTKCWVAVLLLLVLCAGSQLHAQNGELERKAFEAEKAKAQKGAAAAEFNVGSMYVHGHGVAQDFAEAAKWWRKAAEQGFAAAQFNLAEFCAHGLGVPQDYAEAVKWYRKAAEQNLAAAQFSLASCYAKGQGLAKDDAEAVNWYHKAAEQGDPRAQVNLGVSYEQGSGLTKDYAQAMKWYRKAAEQGLSVAQCNLASMYENARSGAKDDAEAARWYRKAAEQGDTNGQLSLGDAYANGYGVPKNYIEAYKWLSLAASQGDEPVRNDLSNLEMRMTPEQVAEAQRLAREFKPQTTSDSNKDTPYSRPTASGTGFFITDDGYLVSNYHVVKDAAQIRLRTSIGMISAKVVRLDAANDLALLKAEGRFASLPIISSRAVKLGGTVATVGFPDTGLQGFAPKFARGEIASLSGAADDARYFQISLPVQPGNSGGALVDEHGNVVGVVSAKLNASAALAETGVLPENVNYAIKSSFVLSFLESTPELAQKVKDPLLKERKFDDVVKSVEDATVLVLVY